MTKLGTSNTGGGCEFQDKVESSQTQQPESWHPVQSASLELIRIEAEALPMKGGKNTQPNTRHFILNIFGILVI